MITPRSLSPWRRSAFIAIGLAAYCGTEWGRYSYRPYVRENLINDWGLADSVGSFGGTIVTVLISVSLIPLKSISVAQAGALSVIGAVTYEFMQPALGTGVFDWKDVVASLTGGGFALIIITGLSGSSSAHAAQQTHAARRVQ
jgi:hypothetical protein